MLQNYLNVTKLDSANDTSVDISLIVIVLQKNFTNDFFRVDILITITD